MSRRKKSSRRLETPSSHAGKPAQPLQSASDLVICQQPPQEASEPKVEAVTVSDPTPAPVALMSWLDVQMKTPAKPATPIASWLDLEEDPVNETPHTPAVDDKLPGKIPQPVASWLDMDVDVRAMETPALETPKPAPKPSRPASTPRLQLPRQPIASWLDVETDEIPQEVHNFKLKEQEPIVIEKPAAKVSKPIASWLDVDIDEPWDNKPSHPVLQESKPVIPFAETPLVDEAKSRSNKPASKSVASWLDLDVSVLEDLKAEPQEGSGVCAWGGIPACSKENHEPNPTLETEAVDEPIEVEPAVIASPAQPKVESAATKPKAKLVASWLDLDLNDADWAPPPSKPAKSPDTAPPKAEASIKPKAKPIASWLDLDLNDAAWAQLPTNPVEMPKAEETVPPELEPCQTMPMPRKLKSWLDDDLDDVPSNEAPARPKEEAPVAKKTFVEPAIPSSKPEASVAKPKPKPIASWLDRDLNDGMWDKPSATPIEKPDESTPKASKPELGHSKPMPKPIASWLDVDLNDALWDKAPATPREQQKEAIEAEAVNPPPVFDPSQTMPMPKKLASWLDMDMGGFDAGPATQPAKAPGEAFDSWPELAMSTPVPVEAVPKEAKAPGEQEVDEPIELPADCNWIDLDAAQQQVDRMQSDVRILKEEVAEAVGTEDVALSLRERIVESELSDPQSATTSPAADLSRSERATDVPDEIANPFKLGRPGSTHSLSSVLTTIRPGLNEGAVVAKSRHLIVTVAGTSYGLSVDQIEQVDRLPGLTPASDFPDCVAGLVKFEGGIIPVIDFHKALRLGSSHASNTARLVILKGGVGLAVDRVRGQRPLPKEHLESAGLAPHHPLARGVKGQSWVERDRIVVLDAQKFVESVMPARKRLAHSS